VNGGPVYEGTENKRPRGPQTDRGELEKEGKVFPVKSSWMRRPQRVGKRPVGKTR